LLRGGNSHLEFTPDLACFVLSPPVLPDASCRLVDRPVGSQWALGGAVGHRGKASEMGLGQLVLGTRVEDRHLPDLRRVAVVLALFLLALNVLDTVATNVLVGNFGAVEINPLMAPLVGTGWMIALKVGLPLVVIALCTRVRSRRPVILLSILVAFYVLVAALGLGQLAYLHI
jgi:hypothetical protein